MLARESAAREQEADEKYNARVAESQAKLQAAVEKGILQDADAKILKGKKLTRDELRAVQERAAAVEAGVVAAAPVAAAAAAAAAAAEIGAVDGKPYSKKNTRQYSLNVYL